MGGGFGGPPPRKIEICKLMCNRLRTLRIGRYAPEHPALVEADCNYSLFHQNLGVAFF